MFSVAIACIIQEKSQKKRKRQRKDRKYWSKPWLLKRNELGFYNNLLEEFRLEDKECYKNYLRISPNSFNELLQLVGDDLTKQNTHLREPIPPEIKLAITLHYLSTGIVTPSCNTNTEFIKAQ